MYRGQLNETGIDASLFDRFELVMSGHYHHRSRKGPVQYLRAPYPMTWQDYNDQRGFHLFDTTTHELTFIDNPYSLFNRIVYNDTDKQHNYINELCQSIIANSPYREAYVKVVVAAKNQPYWFDLMMDSLYKVNALDVMVVDDIVVGDEGEVTESSALIDTVALMQEYVDSLQISCDKDALKTYLRSLYTEAVAANQSGRLS